jgi:hypothetical protein
MTLRAVPVFLVIAAVLLLCGCPGPNNPEDTPVTGVTLDKATLSVAVGATGQITATVTPSDADDPSVTWSSSAAAVASVSATGLVTGVSAGTATITVTTADGGFTAECAVTVTAFGPGVVAVTGVTLDAAAVTIRTGAAILLDADISPADATDTGVSWKSDAPAIASVDADGLVTALAVGSAVITVTTDDGGKTDSCSVTVTDPDVYISGRVSDGSTYINGYWKNGAWNAVGADFIANCIDVVDGTVYLGGADASGSPEVPAYWSGGSVHTRSKLGTTGEGYVYDIEVVNGTVYCGGGTSTDSGKYSAAVWIDGIRHDMTDPATEESELVSIFIHEGIVYALCHRYSNPAA